MDPLTISTVVFIAKAAGAIGGHAIIGQSVLTTTQSIRKVLEDTEKLEAVDQNIKLLCNYIDAGALDQAIVLWKDVRSKESNAKHILVLKEMLIYSLNERREFLQNIVLHGDRFIVQMVQKMIIKIDEKINLINNC